jgi:hypothetical protein
MERRDGKSHQPLCSTGEGSSGDPSARPLLNVSSSAGSSTPSEEDYDENVRPGFATAAEFSRRSEGSKLVAKTSRFTDTTTGYREFFKIGPDDLDALRESFQRAKAIFLF